MDNTKDCFSKPIKIIDVTKKKFNYKFLISTTIALITTLLLLWKEFRGTEIYCKVISMTLSQKSTFQYIVYPDETKTIEGQQYILKLALTCLNNNLIYKDVKAYATYQNEKIPCEIYWSNEDTLAFSDTNGTVTKRIMMIPASEFLTYNSVLETDKVNLFYLKFIVPGKQGPKLYDKLELDFIKPNDGIKKVEAILGDSKQMFYDKDLFK